MHDIITVNGKVVAYKWIFGMKIVIATDVVSI